jgi:transcriptional/translational regulatory protein YebC/TACO1
MSGHSNWSSIGQCKARAGTKHGKVFVQLIKEIQVAATMDGGDPAGNSQLTSAVIAAHAESVPNDIST